MNNVDLQLKMLANIPIHLDRAGEIFLPTLKEIAQMGFSNYNQQLSILLIDKNSFNHPFDDSVTDFDIFYANCYHNESFREVVFHALRLFFRAEPEMVEEEERFFIRLREGNVLDRSNFKALQSILYVANHLKKVMEPEYNPVNSKAQEMINLILKTRKKQPKPKEKMDLLSIVSGLAWKQNGISLQELFELNIYQIYNGFFITNNIDHYHHTITGIYAGTVDGKSINMSDIHWANKI
ncbi:hypothetical protein [Paenibacillus sp. FSL K6-2524]|uniref:hypothetical protein n=1 Tax=Paenibacillus sp. FSL K6-2524 TaxID=2954516 RepID=UPI0030FA4995